MFVKAAATLVTLAAFLAPASAGARTVQATISVTATVAANCAVDASTLAFGAYDPLVRNASADLVATAPLAVRCTAGTSPRLSVSSTATGGQAKPATSARSVLVGPGGAQLSYTFALDAPPVTSGLAHPTTWTLAGTLTHAQAVPDGAYADELVAVVEF